MSGVVVQVSISAGGVPKLPIALGMVSRLGLAGDQHLYKLHGGPGKALLVMAAEVIEALAAEGFSVYFGALGENLTVRNLPHAAWRAGQRYRAGTILLEFTEPRIPCSKLRPYGKGIEKRIARQVGESGFYAAVVEEGRVQAGDRIEIVDGES